MELDVKDRYKTEHEKASIAPSALRSTLGMPHLAKRTLTRRWRCTVRPNVLHRL